MFPTMNVEVFLCLYEDFETHLFRTSRNKSLLNRLEFFFISIQQWVDIISTSALVSVYT